MAQLKKGFHFCQKRLKPTGNDLIGKPLKRLILNETKTSKCSVHQSLQTHGLKNESKK